MTDQATQAAREYVARRIEAERAELTAKIAERSSDTPRLQRAYDEACAELTRIERKHGYDAPITDPERAAARTMEVSGNSLRQQLTAVEQLQRKLRRLDDPAEVERRVNVRLSLSAIQNGGTTMSKAANTTKASKAAKTEGPKEAPKELVDRIVRDINSGIGLTAVAKALTEEGVPTLGKSSKWHPPVVRAIFLKATGLKGVKDTRAANPVASKKTADQPAKPAEKVTPKRGGGKSLQEVVDGEQAAHDAETKATNTERSAGEAKPDPKPASKPRGRGKKATDDTKAVA